MWSVRVAVRLAVDRIYDLTKRIVVQKLQVAASLIDHYINSVVNLFSRWQQRKRFPRRNGVGFWRCDIKSIGEAIAEGIVTVGIRLRA